MKKNNNNSLEDEYINSFMYTSINTGVMTPVCMYFLNMCDIILIGNNIIMLLS